MNNLFGDRLWGGLSLSYFFIFLCFPREILPFQLGVTEYLQILSLNQTREKAWILSQPEKQEAKKQRMILEVLFHLDRWRTFCS